ncbi:toll-like receptor 4 [Dreissena polymorpha]|uniref:TIR domain-containing protein n=1 Tax=Dreissena polymorpha TaxID=45954 RepID=A0A9D4DTZ4_DREPO|nr:toll-like receptor 4 [Dreissena polymorpha]XP_052237063.1 toll-like receptor 4 [Dreissena polymorpha]KAH3754681.1 hypothetical protein DPMN_189362 [Dreissena polymorpha]
MSIFMLLMIGLPLTPLAERIDDMCFPCVCVSSDERGLYKVDCRSKTNLEGRLPQFRTINDSQIRSLNMSGTSLFNLEKQTQTPFENYRSLQELDLYNTSINLLKNNNATVTSETFKGLDTLEVLNIAHNDFPVTSETDSNVFVRLTSLKKLFMYQINVISSGNTSYPGQILKNISTLEEVWIDGFSVVPFGTEFQNMPNLKVIRISGDLIRPIWQYKDYCDIQIVDESTFANLLYVRNLSILNCGVTAILSNAFTKMEHLRMLDLSMNYELGFDNLDGLSSLNSELEVLILDSVKNTNKLECPTQIMKSTVELIQHLKTLKMLSLDNNKISEIDKDAFEKTPAILEHLRVRSNKFELGYYMLYACQMKNLRKLEASFSHMDLQFTSLNDNLELSHPPIHLYYNSTFTGITHKHVNTLFLPKENTTHAGHTNDVDCLKRPLYYIPPVAITAFLPPKLEYIDISHSKIGFPIYGFYIDSENSLKTVIASNSLLYCWAGPVHGVHNIETIDLSNNFCSNVNENFFTSFPKLKRLHLQRNYLYIVVAYKKIFMLNNELEYIDLSINRINKIHPKLFTNQTKMKWINLSSNNLMGFDYTIPQMKSLHVLNLSANHIMTLSKELRSDLEGIVSSRNNINLTLDLTDNVLTCSCDNLEVLEWILEHTLPTSNSLIVIISICYYTHNVSSELPSPVLISGKEDLYFQVAFLQKFCLSYTPLLISLVVILFVIFNIIIGAIIHRFRWKIRYWYYVGNNKDVSFNDYISIEGSLRFQRFKYDIYLAYEEDAREFVLEILRPKLAELGYGVFVHDDILEGLPLCNVLTKSIHASRVVVFVLSRGSRESLEWKIAAHMTNEESNHRGKPISLAMFYDSNSTRGLPEGLQLMRRDAFIDYPANGNEDECTAFFEDFKDKVKFIMNTKTVNS